MDTLGRAGPKCLAGFFLDDGERKPIGKLRGCRCRGGGRGLEDLAANLTTCGGGIT